MKLSEFKIGDRVIGEYYDRKYSGVIQHIHRDQICILRDDGMNGGGCEGRWQVKEYRGEVRSDGLSGEPLKLEKLEMAELIKDDLLVAKISEKYKPKKRKKVEKCYCSESGLSVPHYSDDH